MSGSVSDRLLLLRNLRGWSQDQPSAISGVAVRTIQRIERARGRPRLANMMALTSALQTDVTQLQQAGC